MEEGRRREETEEERERNRDAFRRERSSNDSDPFWWFMLLEPNIRHYKTRSLNSFMGQIKLDQGTHKFRVNKLRACTTEYGH